MELPCCRNGSNGPCPSAHWYTVWVTVTVAQVCTRTYTQVYGQINPYASTKTSIQTQTSTHIHTHIHIQTYTHAHIHTHPHTNSVLLSRRGRLPDKRICIRTHPNAYTHTHTHTHTHINTHPHTYTHIHTHELGTTAQAWPFAWALARHPPALGRVSGGQRTCSIVLAWLTRGGAYEGAMVRQWGSLVGDCVRC